MAMKLKRAERWRLLIESIDRIERQRSGSVIRKQSNTPAAKNRLLYRAIGNLAATLQKTANYLHQSNQAKCRLRLTHAKFTPPINIFPPSSLV